MWEKSSTHYFATKIPGILAEKIDRNVSVNSTREPAHSIYLPKSLRKLKNSVKKGDGQNVIKQNVILLLHTPLKHLTHSPAC